MFHVCALQSRDWPISECKKGPARTQSEWTALKPPSSLPRQWQTAMLQKKWNCTRESFFFIALFFNWQCQEFYCALPTCSSQKTHTNDTKQTNYWLHTLIWRLHSPGSVKNFESDIEFFLSFFLRHFDAQGRKESRRHWLSAFFLVQLSPLDDFFPPFSFSTSLCPS